MTTRGSSWTIMGSDDALWSILGRCVKTAMRGVHLLALVALREHSGV